MRCAYRHALLLLHTLQPQQETDPGQAQSPAAATMVIRMADHRVPAPPLAAAAAATAAAGAPAAAAAPGGSGGASGWAAPRAAILQGLKAVLLYSCCSTGVGQHHKDQHQAVRGCALRAAREIARRPTPPIGTAACSCNSAISKS